MQGWLMEQNIYPLNMYHQQISEIPSDVMKLLSNQYQSTETDSLNILNRLFD